MHRHQAKGETRYGQADPALCQAAFRATVPVSSRRHGRRHGRNPESAHLPPAHPADPEVLFDNGGIHSNPACRLSEQIPSATADPVAILST
jgi:hypothetical protein